MIEKEIRYYLGGILGAVIGFGLAKIYQIWAILYATEGFALEGVGNWEGQPLWEIVNENPGMVTFLVTLIFFLLGICFTHFLTKKSNV